MLQTGNESRDLAREFAARGPWVTRFVIAGTAYGGDYDAMADIRLEQFFRCFPRSTRILELGSLEGGHTFALASRPSVEHVLGLEGRSSNVSKAEFVRKLLEVRNVEFVTANLETADLAAFGQFDAVFCCGLLYHLPEPWRLIEQIARISPHLFLWTHYVAEASNTTSAHGIPGAVYQEFNPADASGGSTVLAGLKRAIRKWGLRGEYALDGMSLTSFWPTLEGLQVMLERSGFRTIDRIEDNPEHPHGPAITLGATAGC